MKTSLMNCCMLVLVLPTTVDAQQAAILKVKPGRAAVVKLSLATKQTEQAIAVAAGAFTRGEFARQWWQAIQKLPEKP
jgi:arginine repressor